MCARVGGREREEDCKGEGEGGSQPLERLITYSIASLLVPCIIIYVFCEVLVMVK